MSSIVSDRRRSALLYAVSVLVVLAAWELATRDMSRIIIAPPSEILARLWSGMVSGRLSGAFLGSLQHMSLGLVLALTIALPLGILLGRSARSSDVLMPVLSALYAIPPVAFVPILVIWFGMFFESRVALVVLMSTFEMMLAFAAGAREIPPALINVGRAFGAGRRFIMTRVMLPAMLPFLFSGLRLGFVRAIHAMIVAELFFAAANLGQIMKRDAQRFDSTGVLAVIVMLALFGLFLQEGSRWLEGRLFAHRGRR